MNSARFAATDDADDASTGSPVFLSSSSPSGSESQPQPQLVPALSPGPAAAPVAAPAPVAAVTLGSVAASLSSLRAAHAATATLHARHLASLRLTLLHHRAALAALRVSLHAASTSVAATASAAAAAAAAAAARGDVCGPDGWTLGVGVGDRRHWLSRYARRGLLASTLVLAGWTLLRAAGAGIVTQAPVTWLGAKAMYARTNALGANAAALASSGVGASASAGAGAGAAALLLLRVPPPLSPPPLSRVLLGSLVDGLTLALPFLGAFLLLRPSAASPARRHLATALSCVFSLLHAAVLSAPPAARRPPAAAAAAAAAASRLPPLAAAGRYWARAVAAGAAALMRALAETLVRFCIRLRTSAKVIGNGLTADPSFTC